jgi:hypothetical protein
MRRLQPSLYILVLALVGCAGETGSEPSPSQGQAQGQARTAVPLTAQEVESYRQDLAQVFARRAQVPLRRGATGATADLAGHANVALVKVDADGNLDTVCVDSEQEAMQFLTSAGGEGR